MKTSAIRQYTIKRQFLALGTINQICLYDQTDNKLIDKAVNRVMEIDDKMSAFKKDSEISGVNQNAGVKPVIVSEETFRLLQLSKEISKLSGGAFDITLRPLIKLWGINKKLNYIPERHDIDKALKITGYKNLVLNEKNCSAYLKKSGQAIDLGGIAKGYAADEVKRILVEGGVTSAIINLGGNIVALGAGPNGLPWEIGIQNPAAERGIFLGILSAANKTIVTSGSNERFFIKDGVRYHHILDPRTGKPAKSGLLGVTAVGECSAIADAVSTAVFVLGMEKGINLLKKFKLEAVFALDDYKICLTEGLINKFTVN